MEHLADDPVLLAAGAAGLVVLVLLVLILRAAARGPQGLVQELGWLGARVQQLADGQERLAGGLHHVSEAQALSSVFGYACFNDGSVRDYQRKTTQWTVGKNFDGTGAFGPWLVTADELPPGAKGLRIQSRLNGQVMQDATTDDMVFDVARTISLLSHAMTLEAGDVIVMGTPAGVGYARTPPVFMKAGDTIEIEVEGMGVLFNPVTD